MSNDKSICAWCTHYSENCVPISKMLAVLKTRQRGKCMVKTSFKKVVDPVDGPCWKMEGNIHNEKEKNKNADCPDFNPTLGTRILRFFWYRK